MKHALRIARQGAAACRADARRRQFSHAARTALRTVLLVGENHADGAALTAVRAALVPLKRNGFATVAVEYPGYLNSRDIPDSGERMFDILHSERASAFFVHKMFLKAYKNGHDFATQDSSRLVEEAVDGVLDNYMTMNENIARVTVSGALDLFKRVASSNLGSFETHVIRLEGFIRNRGAQRDLIKATRNNKLHYACIDTRDEGVNADRPQLEERDHLMAANVQDTLQDGNVVAIVGTAHLRGMSQLLSSVASVEAVAVYDPACPYQQKEEASYNALLALSGGACIPSLALPRSEHGVYDTSAFTKYLERVIYQCNEERYR